MFEYRRHFSQFHFVLYTLSTSYFALYTAFLLFSTGWAIKYFELFIAAITLSRPTANQSTLIILATNGPPVLEICKRWIGGSQPTFVAPSRPISSPLDCLFLIWIRPYYYYKHLLQTIQRLNSEQTIKCNGKLKGGVEPPLI